MLQPSVVVGLALLSALSGGNAWAADLSAGPLAARMMVVSSEQLQELSAFDGTPRSTEQLMSRNLQDYFAVYQTPVDPQESSRLLRTAEAISRDYLVVLIQRASRLARAGATGFLQPGHVRQADGALLPAEAVAFGEVIFFPDASQQDQVLAEAYDLDALRDTGMAWRVLRAYAEDAGPEAEEAPAAVGEVVVALAEAVNAYGLVIFRVAGEQATHVKARYLRTQHLRQAVKEVERRAADLSTPGTITIPAPRKPTLFTDRSQAAGIDFRHRSSDWLSRFRRYGGRFPTFSGGGVTAGDMNGDGWPDLIFCGGQGCSCFLNQGDGTFRDGTEASGINVPGEARMSLLVDFDNDGHRDLFITYANEPNRLFRGTGHGRFDEVTSGSGLGSREELSGAAIAFDYDNDSLLDLFVTNFGDYMEGASPWITKNARNGQPSRLFHNEGGLTFREVTVEAGIEETGWSQAVSHLDFDNDGDQDIYIANDFGRNAILVNGGDGTFSSRGRETFTDSPFHGMNVAFTDLNRDLHPDIFVTNIWTVNAAQGVLTEFNTLLLSRVAGGGELRYRIGHMAEFSQVDTGWSWAALFFDMENDGDDDLYVVNGNNSYFTFFQERLHPERTDQYYPRNHHGESNLLFRNDAGRFVHVASGSGTEIDDTNSRGLALLDMDRDGDLDLAVSTFHSRAHLLRNDAASPESHWLVVELVGDPEQGTSRDAIGARVIVRSHDGLYVWRSVQGGEGYLSMSTLALEFGLGSATRVDLEIFWPGQRRQEIRGVAADRAIRIVQGQEPVLLDGWNTGSTPELEP